MSDEMMQVEITPYGDGDSVNDIYVDADAAVPAPADDEAAMDGEAEQIIAVKVTGADDEPMPRECLCACCDGALE